MDLRKRQVKHLEIDRAHARSRKLPDLRAVVDRVALVLERWGRRARAWTISPLPDGLSPSP